MGADAYLYAVGPVTDDELVAANKYMLGRDNGFGDNCEGEYLMRSEFPPEHDRIEFHNTQRLYDLEYTKGNWPIIYGAIRLMQAAFPQCVIHYGSDGMDDCPVVTDERMEEIWAFYLGPDGKPPRY